MKYLVCIFAVYAFGCIYVWFNRKDQIFSIVEEEVGNNPKAKHYSELAITFMACRSLLWVSLLWPILYGYAFFVILKENNKV